MADLLTIESDRIARAFNKSHCASSQYMSQQFTIQQYMIHARIIQTCLLYIEINRDIKEVKSSARIVKTWLLCEENKLDQRSCNF